MSKRKPANETIRKLAKVKKKPQKKQPKIRKAKGQKATGVSIVIKGARGNDIVTGLRVIEALLPAVEAIANVTRQSAWSIQGKFKKRMEPSAVIPSLAIRARPFDIDPPLKLSIGVQLTDKSFAPLAWQDSRNLAEALAEFEVNGTKLELRYSNGKRV